MQMLRERLAPRVQHRRDADRTVQVPRIAPEGEQCVGGGAKEQRVEDTRIALGEGVEVVWQREDHVEVRDRQEVHLPRGEPPLLRQGLTFRAVPVATRVVRDPYGAAPVTCLPMSAQEGGPAGRDRPKRPGLDRREPVRPAIRLAVGPHNVRELQPRAADRDRRAHRHGTHGLPQRRRGEPLQQIERRVRPHLCVAGQLKVARRRTDVPVPKQPLDRVDVDTGFEQVRRERMA